MKKLVLIAVFLLGFSVMVMAQDTPAFEVFGGYTFVRVDTSTAFDLSSSEGFDLNMNGWNASIAIDGNKWLGFVADFGGIYGSVADISEAGDVSVRTHSIMIGPRISVRKEKITPFFQVLLGYAHISAEESGENVFSENDLAMAVGGGVDVNVNNRIAIRPVQVEYFTTKAGSTGDFADNLRYSAGIVIKLGKR